MITNALINLAYYILSVVVGVLPASSGFPPDVLTSASLVGQYLDLLDPILPVTTLATVLAVGFFVELAILAFRGVRWVVAFLPFVGGKG